MDTFDDGLPALGPGWLYGVQDRSPAAVGIPAGGQVQVLVHRAVDGRVREVLAARLGVRFEGLVGTSVGPVEGSPVGADVTVRVEQCAPFCLRVSASWAPGAVVVTPAAAVRGQLRKVLTDLL